VVAAQVANAVSASGIYPWQLTAEVDYNSGSPVTSTLAGNLGVVVRDQNNPYGAGWGLAGIDQLVLGSNQGVLWATGTGDARVFTGNPGTLTYTYTSPANDFGTLVQNTDHSFTYTAPDQTTSNFDSSGRLTQVRERHGLSLGYSYDTQGS
jgi:hypothetical protein